MNISLNMTGCRNNRYELDQILNWAIKNGVGVVDDKEADYAVINTCTVTHVADKKSRQMVRKTKNAHPQLQTIVFGCAARMQKKQFEEVMEVDHLIPDMPGVIQFLQSQLGEQRKCDWNLSPAKSDFARSRPMVQVQDGCDTYCSYCIIAPARGKSKNRTVKEIVDEIQDHADHGYNEVVLTGINIGAYGAPNTKATDESQFAELIEAILEQTTIPRIRLSSVGPEFFDDRLHQAVNHPRVCRHIHLSIQSGCTTVLERMKRLYTAEKTSAVIEQLKKDIPNIAITTDLIAGFPGETEEEFEETLNFVKKHKLAKVHAFPYSVRENTLAAKMKNQVDPQEKRRRMKALQALAEEHRRKFIESQLGETVNVVWGRQIKPGFFQGLTDHYIKVRKRGGDLRASMSQEKLNQLNIMWD